MVKKHRQRYVKVVDERYTLPEKRGGGVIKFEVWGDQDGLMVKYSMAYINHSVHQGDNGRVIGYDNTHDYHHKHYFGKVSPVEDFVSYEEIVERFENEIREYTR